MHHERYRTFFAPVILVAVKEVKMVFFKIKSYINPNFVSFCALYYVIKLFAHFFFLNNTNTQLLSTIYQIILLIAKCTPQLCIQFVQTNPSCHFVIHQFKRYSFCTPSLHSGVKTIQFAVLRPSK